ncbi:hypothetical protein CcCBS67573_g02668 [Chytriomyces confervae]|uniref:RRM domain-containing protein n=1 Tax=Chytriomyces confervae TaxID=246404 RepID=A0A507FIL0_9FUNG|nr:hypothetical protein CcCBS67573_g02668 [Chytriomyces confervae]
MPPASSLLSMPMHHTSAFATNSSTSSNSSPSSSSAFSPSIDFSGHHQQQHHHQQHHSSSNMYYKNSSGNGVSLLTPTTIIHSKKTTIHVSNIQINRAQLRLHFREYEGFRRISFHQDYIFVCFGDVVSAADAITKIHNETEMNAAYAKHGVASNSTPTIQVAPNPILYVSIFPCFGEAELMEIFSAYDGFDSCRFFPMHALVRFVNLETAKRALEDLNMTTNLFANYSTKSTKTVGDVKARIPGRLTQEPISLESPVQSTLKLQQQQQLQSLLLPASQATPSKCTIHVTNLDKDIPTLLQFFKSLPGFARVAFYIDYAFVIFKDSDSASAAIETILFGSRMKANFARSDYTPHIVPASALGIPSSLVRISDYPSTTTEEDLRRLLESFRGVSGLNVFHSSALVTFESVEAAGAMVDDLNGCTNLTCVFGKRKGSSGGLLQVQQQSQHALQPTGSTESLVLSDEGLSPRGYEYGLGMGSAHGDGSTISPHAGGLFQNSAGADKEVNSVFENMFPSLTGSAQTDSFHHAPFGGPNGHHLVSQRASSSTLGSSSSGDTDERRNGLLVGSQARHSHPSKLSIPPGFAHINNTSGGNFYNQQHNSVLYGQQHHQQQPIHQQTLHQQHATLQQARSTSFPSLSALNFSSNSSSNSITAFQNLSLYPSSGNESFLPGLQQQQQQGHDLQHIHHSQPSQPPLRHLSTSSSSQALFSAFQHGSNAPEFFPQESDYMNAFASSSTPPPPPGITHSYPAKTAVSVKRPLLSKTISTPPSTPYTRTTSPLGQGIMNQAGNVSTTNNMSDAVSARLAQLEAENAALRRNAKNDFPSLSAGTASTSKANGGAGTGEAGRSGSGGTLDSAVIARELMVRMSDSMQPLASPTNDDLARHDNGGDCHNDTDSEETSVAVVAASDVDWKSSFEKAVDELVKARERVAAQQTEFERFQALHKNCGFLQGLLNICD